MNDLDMLTLQLLSSKKRYNQYLENSQPNKANEIQEFYGKIRKHKFKIRQTMEKYLDHPETQTTNEVDEVIEACFKTLIKHYEILNRENKSYLKDYDETDSSEEEEVLFAEPVKEAEAEADEVEVEVEASPPQAKPSLKSFWGNKITKIPSTNLDSFIRKKTNPN